MKRNRKHLNEKAYSLIGCDGNAFAVMAYVSKAMRECGHDRDEINAYLDDAKSSDYHYLLAVSMDMLEMLNQEQGYKEGHQFTKPDSHDSWEYQGPDYAEEDDEYEEYFESKKSKKGNKLTEAYYPDFDEVEIEADDNIIEVAHLLPMSKEQKCLYITPEDFDSINSSLQDFMVVLNKGGYNFEMCQCGGALEVLLTRKDLYDFNQRLAKDLKKIGVNIMDLTPFIYTYDDMQPIINNNFKKHFNRK